MGYRIYVTNPTGEVRALFLVLLRIKQEKGTLEPGESELLVRLQERGALAGSRSPRAGDDDASGG